MFERENPWSEWLGDGVFAHPNAPCRGGGAGRRIGAPSGHGGAVSPWSPAGRDISPRDAAQGYAEYELERVLRKLFFCHQPSELLSIAGEAFGRASLSKGFSQALAKHPPARRFFAIQRMMVQAELHDHLQGMIGWERAVRFSTINGPRLWEVGHSLRFSSTTCHHHKLVSGATSRDALLKELAALFTEPAKVFEEARAKLPATTSGHWALYNDLAKTCGHRTDAGNALGTVVAEVLIALSELQRRGDFQARLTGAAPLLAKYAEGIGAASETGLLTAGLSSRPAITPSRMAATPDAVASAIPSSPTSPPRSVPSPTEEERMLAAQENSQPDDGLNESRFSAREKVIRDFYEGRPGLGQLRADQDMGCHPLTREPNKHAAGYGIDLSFPVKVVDIPPPPRVEQYVKPHGNPGNFFDPIGGQSADKLGLNGDPKLRQSRSFSVKETAPKQQALISRNGPVIDGWTDESNPIATKGTGTQMTVDNMTKAGLTPQPQPW